MSAEGKKHSQHLRTSYRLRTTLNTLHLLTHLILRTPLHDIYYCSCFTHEETEAWIG